MTVANQAPAPDNPPADRSADHRRLGLLALALAASLLVVSLIGSSLAPMVALGTLLLKLGTLWPGVVYLVAAFGLAWPLRRLWRGSPDSVPIQLAVGVAVMFSLSHLLGVLGLLNSITAIGVCAVGLGLVGVQLAGLFRAGERPAPLGAGQTALLALAMPAAAVLIVAALMPPGVLWGSEYGGFDALSYHLQLPQEWLASGRIAPVEHNVYSYLPSSIESAFMHLGAMTLAPNDPLSPDGLGLLGGDGWRLLACQGLHAGLAVVAAWLTARATTRLAIRAAIAEPIARWAGAAAGCVALATPWAVVTGSLAYNEAGVNAMLAGVLLVCAQERLSPVARGTLVGLLVGVACGFKPTALFFVGLPAGLLLIASCSRFPRNPDSSPRATDAEPRTSVRGSGEHESPPGLKSGARKDGDPKDGDPRDGDPRDGDPKVTTLSRRLRTLAPALLLGAVVGLLTLSPWLLRNAIHSGNPVFPFAADVLGSAHWTSEQLARYQSAHTFDGSLADRLRTLLWTSPTSAPGDPAVTRFRGLANPQWGLLPVFVVGALAVLGVVGGRTRSTALLLAACLGTQLLAWLAFTHLQSRFLLPMLPIGATLVGLAVARLGVLVGERPDGRGGVALLAGIAVAGQSVFTLAIYSSQNNGSAGLGLPIFPAAFTGREDESPAATAKGWSNTRPLDDGLVLLVGDSTPLYFGPGVVYHTTYDTSPLGELMRDFPDDPAAVARGLREMGIGWLLVSDSELRRLQASGWYDPDVTADRVREFADSLGGAAMLWSDERRSLVRIPSEPTP
ncbi:MAG: hypothetical protein Q9O74_10910 [Planctomycetota bacterium]|nr:hypothetical protein [Planctomycetota bacterium]